MVFYHVLDPKLHYTFKIVGTRAVILKKFDEKRNDFTGPFTLPALTEFFQVNSMKLLYKFDYSVYNMIFYRRTPVLMLFYDEWEHSAEKMALRAAAKTLKGQIHISHADYSTVNQ
jgi:protein disulfide-isomerase A1